MKLRRAFPAVTFGFGENQHHHEVRLVVLNAVVSLCVSIRRLMTVFPLFFFSDHLSGEFHHGHGRARSSSPSAGTSRCPRASGAQPRAPLRWSRSRRPAPPGPARACKAAGCSSSSCMPAVPPDRPCSLSPRALAGCAPRHRGRRPAKVPRPRPLLPYAHRSSSSSSWPWRTRSAQQGRGWAEVEDEIITSLPLVRNLHCLVILISIGFVQVALVLYCGALHSSANVFHITCYFLYIAKY